MTEKCITKNGKKRDENSDKQKLLGSLAYIDLNPLLAAGLIAPKTIAGIRLVIIFRPKIKIIFCPPILGAFMSNLDL